MFYSCFQRPKGVKEILLTSENVHLRMFYILYGASFVVQEFVRKHFIHYFLNFVTILVAIYYSFCLLKSSQVFKVIYSAFGYFLV